ncbi:long-chain fatty acid--CoA ligase, partial [candidate division KSB1 bacterium]|nr:long-chain fatty acid--CoA ligase [candidate division KSB1 bacterium]
ADENGISYSDVKELLTNEQVYQAVEADVKKLTKELARFEQVKKFTLMPREFTIADDELTPTLKVKRKVVAEKYADIINQMYIE